MAEIDIILPRATGGDGNAGWTPVLAVVADGNRRVQRVTDWTGGTGTKPATGQYVGPTGLVSNIASATDIAGTLASDKAAAEASAQAALAAKNDAAQAATAATGAVQAVSETADNVNAVYQDTLTAQGATVAAFQGTQAIADEFGNLEGAIGVVEAAATEATAAKDESEQIRDDFLAYTIPADVVTGALPDPVSQALFLLQDAWAVQPEIDVLAAYERFVADTVDDGNWQLADYVVFLNGHTQQAQRFNAKNPSEVLQIAGTPTLTPFVGYTGAASSALFLASTAFSQASQDNFHAALWLDTPGTLAASFPLDMTTANIYVTSGGPPAGGYRAADGTTTAVAGIITASSLLVAARRESTTKRFFRNGVQANTAAVTSTGLPPRAYIGANSLLSGYSDATSSVFISGAAGSDAQQASLYAATKRFVETMRTFA